MDTNLKKSKMIRALICKVIATAALISAIGTGIMGREAITDFVKYGPQVFSGKLYDYPEFREFASELYNKAMIGYAGTGDDAGYPMTDQRAQKYAREALAEFSERVSTMNGDIVYFLREWVNKGSNYVDKGNVKYPVLSEYDGHLLLPDDVLLCCYWNGSEEKLIFFDETYEDVYNYNPVKKYDDTHYQPNKNEAKKIKLLLAVKKDCVSARLNSMEEAAAKYQYILIFFIAYMAIWLVFSLFSLYLHRAGKVGKEEYAKASGRVFAEFKLIMLVVTVFVAWYFNLLAFEYNFAFRMRAYKYLWIYFLISCIWYLLYLDIMKNKEKVLLRTIPVVAVRHIIEIIKQEPWCRRALVYNVGIMAGGIITLVVGLVMLVASLLHVADWKIPTIILGIILIAVGCILLICRPRQKKLIKDMAAIVDRLEEVKNGQMGEPLQLSKNSLLLQAAENLNDLEAGIERAVEEQNRSNKMRVELITNVSHDLKTPLTSIINYADLLCEEDLPEASAEYAKALQGKAYRLKNMVQDVFDLSKATSGNLNVETVTLDLVKLIKQTLADMDERIQESTLTFKLNISTEPLLIEADGEKLYRVFQNLFVNALQYSLDNSRVHIQLREESGVAVACVKNTSRMELDFDTSEIVERFVRADSSRTTEGSGLGLSIVQSFVEACGGEFTVETDADMFTANVRFPLSKKQMMEGGPFENT